MTLPRTGCRSPPTGPSRRRRGCSPAPRTCTTSRSTAARSSTPPPACGASMPAVAPPQSDSATGRQEEALNYPPPFQFGIPQAFELASRIADIAPKGLDHVFFCNSGSEAADTALKIALAYHQINAQGTRTRLIGRERGYHGVGFGGTSVGGIVNNRKMFGTLLAGVDHLPATYDRDKQAFTKGEPEYGAHFADELERLVNLQGASPIPAVIAEPMAGSTGVAAHADG